MMSVHFKVPSNVRFKLFNVLFTVPFTNSFYNNLSMYSFLSHFLSLSQGHAGTNLVTDRSNEDTTRARNLDGHIPVDEIPYLM